MGPSHPGYSYELERLRLQFRGSQESLRIEREQAAAQLALFERERAAQELRHRQELDAVRRQHSSDTSKGKRRM
jgi:hypothetical protein